MAQSAGLNALRSWDVGLIEYWCTGDVLSINGVVVTWVVAIDPPGVRFPLNAFLTNTCTCLFRFFFNVYDRILALGSLRSVSLLQYMYTHFKA